MPHRRPPPAPGGAAVATPARTLDRLHVGEGGEIAALRGDGALTQRIMALGLLPGSRLTVVGVAPLGDPLTISTSAGRISLRRSEARAIELKPRLLTECM